MSEHPPISNALGLQAPIECHILYLEKPSVDVCLLFHEQALPEHGSCYRTYGCGMAETCRRFKENGVLMRDPMNAPKLPSLDSEMSFQRRSTIVATRHGTVGHRLHGCPPEGILASQRPRKHKGVATEAVTVTEVKRPFRTWKLLDNVKAGAANKLL